MLPYNDSLKIFDTQHFDVLLGHVKKYIYIYIYIYIERERERKRERKRERVVYKHPMTSNTFRMYTYPRTHNLSHAHICTLLAVIYFD